MYVNATELSHSEIMVWDLGGVARQHRTSGTSQWGAVAWDHSTLSRSDTLLSIAS